jgi:hypothetical protein
MGRASGTFFGLNTVKKSRSPAYSTLVRTRSPTSPVDFETRAKPSTGTASAGNHDLHDVPVSLVSVCTVIKTALPSVRHSLVRTGRDTAARLGLCAHACLSALRLCGSLGRVALGADACLVRQKATETRLSLYRKSRKSNVWASDYGTCRIR